MARVRWISRLVGLEEAGLLLDGVGLHNNVMLDQFRLLTGLKRFDKVEIRDRRLHFVATRNGSVSMVGYTCFQKSNM